MHVPASELCLEVGKELPRVPSGEFTMPHNQRLHTLMYIAHTKRMFQTLTQDQHLEL